MNAARVALLMSLALATAQHAVAQAPPEDQFVVIPLRVHVLTAPDLELANCTLSDADAARVIGHVNAIWHHAGLHFGVESIVREPAEERERFRITTEPRGGEADPSELAMLLPRASRGFDGLHVYLFHSLPFNSSYLGGDIVVAHEGAEVQPITGGGNDPVARVTAHALGNALGLPKHSDVRNLMSNGTSGVALNSFQGEAAREVGRTVRGATTVPLVRKALEAAEANGDSGAAHRLRSWLAEISDAVAAAARQAEARAAKAQARDSDRDLIVPLRVHVLAAPGLELAYCKLTDADILRVIDKVNVIWHHAAVHFGPESIVREPADQQERFRIMTERRGREAGPPELAMLLPRSSRSFDGFHLYLFHSLPFNSAFLGDDTVIAQEEAQVVEVKGGATDPLARVIAHSLGNALGLTNDPEPRNLMSGGTSGVALDDTQAETVLKVAPTVRGVRTLAEVRKAAEAAEAKGEGPAARRLWSWLAEVPSPGAAAAKRHRDALAPTSHTSQPNNP